MTERRNILVIDGNDYHYELLRDTLAEAPVRFMVTRAGNLDKGKKLLHSRRYDLVVTENHDTQTTERWLTDLKKQAHGAPVVVLTSRSDEKSVVAAMKNGADDYLIKNRDNLRHLTDSLVKTIAKRKQKPLAPLSVPGRGMHLLTQNLKTIARLVNQPTQTLIKGKTQIKRLEKELENIKGLLRNWVS